MKKEEERLITVVRDFQQKDKLVTLRELAKITRKSQKYTLQLCEDIGLCVNVGIGIGGGSLEYTDIGDYSIEDLEYWDIIDNKTNHSNERQ